MLECRGGRLAKSRIIVDSIILSEGGLIRDSRTGTERHVRYSTVAMLDERCHLYICDRLQVFIVHQGLQKQFCRTTNWQQVQLLTENHQYLHYGKA